MNYIEDIKNFIPSCQQEEKEKRIIVDLMEKNKDNMLKRESELFHFTCSGFTMNEARNKTLMVHHNIYNSWSWIGGHADGEKDFLSVALREVKEETGVVTVRPLWSQVISLDILTTSGHMKNGSYVPSHLHFNISYLLVAEEKEPLRIKPDENSGVKWIEVRELEKYVTEPEMLKVYKKILERARAWEKK